jgi:hypothetical protein
MSTEYRAGDTSDGLVVGEVEELCRLCANDESAFGLVGAAQPYHSFSTRRASMSPADVKHLETSTPPQPLRPGSAYTHHTTPTMR